MTKKSMTSDELHAHLNKGIELHDRLQKKIDAIDAQATEDKRPLKALQQEIKEDFAKHIKIGELEKAEVPAGKVRVTSRPSYTCQNQLATNDWILDPLPDTLSQKRRREVLRRMAIYKGTLTAEVVRDFRQENGGTYIKDSKRMSGGTLMPGVVCKESSYITITPTKQDDINDEQTTNDS